jgi:hypothetical protein
VQLPVTIDKPVEAQNDPGVHEMYVDMAVELQSMPNGHAIGDELLPGQ